MATDKVDEPVIVIETEQAKAEVNRSSVEKEKKSKVENKEFYKNMFKAKLAKSKAKEAMSKAKEFHVERRIRTWRPDEDQYVATVRTIHLRLGHYNHEEYGKCTPSKQTREGKVQQRQPVDADLGHPDESNEALHDVISRLAAKPANQVSDNDIRQASDLQYETIRAEMARTDSQVRPMTAEEKAVKQAFIDKTISTWNPTNDTNKTVEIDDTWPYNKRNIMVEPNKASDVFHGPDASIDRIEPEEEQMFEACDSPPEDSHSNDAPAVSDEILQDQRRHLHRESIEGESGIMLRDEYRHRIPWSVASGKAYPAKIRGRINLGKRPKLRSTDLVWDTGNTDLLHGPKTKQRESNDHEEKMTFEGFGET